MLAQARVKAQMFCSGQFYSSTSATLLADTVSDTNYTGMLVRLLGRVDAGICFGHFRDVFASSVIYLQHVQPASCAHWTRLVMSCYFLNFCLLEFFTSEHMITHESTPLTSRQ